MTKRTRNIVGVWTNIHGMYKNVSQKFEEYLRNEIDKVLAVLKIDDLILKNKMPFNKLSIDYKKTKIFSIFTKYLFLNDFLNSTHFSKE